MKRFHLSSFDSPSRGLVAAALAAAAMLLAGCSGLGGGTSLTCKLPDGARCDSVSNTYSESMRGELPGQRRRGSVAPDPGASGASQRAGDGAPMMYTDARMTQIGMPLRSQPRIVRIWIKPWEDADGDLHDQTFVYLSIDEGRWMVEHKQREVRDPYAPARSAPNVSTRNLTPVPAPEKKMVATMQPPTSPQDGKPTAQMLEAVQRAKSGPTDDTPKKAEGGRRGS